MEQNTQQDRAKLLEQQAREYLMQSKDPIFTQYVQQLRIFLLHHYVTH